MASREKILRYVEALQWYVLDPMVISAVMQIENLDRKLLAIRGYIRYVDVKHKCIRDNWAWNDAQKAEWYASAAYAQACGLLDDIARTFRRANDGFRLEQKRQVRTVEMQVDNWRFSKQVLRLGGELRAKISQRLDRDEYSDYPGGNEAHLLREYIAGTSVSEQLYVATPGLSDHGHGNAFDTEVLSTKGKMMAACHAAWISTWDGPHRWTEKLYDAVMMSGGGRFKGPLKAPYEPWHYEYDHGQA